MYKCIIVFLMALSIIACKRLNKIDESSDTDSTIIIPEQSFKISGLNRDRKIRIYLPINYNQSSQKYPVLYMHDGQNLFEDSTSYVGEWGVDENLDQLSLTSNFDLIVVGIDNGQEKRVQEMSPWENKKYGNAEGEEYMRFIVKQVKPFIDSSFRTLADRDNTAIMGSSMGGLISHYAIYAYPEVFGKAGLFSSSYWYSDQVYDYTLNNPIPKDTRLYIMVGSKEGDAVNDSQKMYDTILETSHPKKNVAFAIDPDGEHNEASWRKQFTPAIEWMFK